MLRMALNAVIRVVTLGYAGQEPAAAAEVPKQAQQSPHPKQPRKAAPKAIGSATVIADALTSENDNSGTTLVQQQMAELEAAKVTAQKKQQEWIDKLKDLGANGAEERGRVQAKDTHDIKGYFATLWQNIKDYCESADKFIRDELEKKIGAHIGDLHVKLKQKIKDHDEATDPAIKKSLAVDACNLALHIEVERYELANNILLELQTCMTDAQYASMFTNLAIAAIIHAITTIPVPTPDLQIVQSYEFNLSMRIKASVIERKQLDAALDGTEAAAMIAVSSDTVKAQAPEVTPAAVEQRPEATSIPRRLSLSGGSGAGLFCRPQTPPPAAPAPIPTVTYGGCTQ